MLAILLSNLFLLDSAFYKITMALQAAFYAMAALAWLGEKANLRLKVFSIPLYFSTVNIASVVSMYKTLKGFKAVTWETIRK